MNLTLQEILDATGGVLLHGNPSRAFTSLSTDSRTMKAGDLFVCLKGERFDAHDFIEDTLQKKPSAILIQKNRWDSQKWNASPTVFIGVEDPLFALGNIAKAWRRKFTIPLVAITGSNGKTTTKDMATAVLSEQYRTLATEGNLNNLIGVPLTLLKLKKGDEAAVIEMGMNDFGEIDRLTEIAEPTVGLITNVGGAHLEKLKSLEGVAKAKGELFERLPSGALALVNQDDPLVSKLPTRAYKISYGLEKPGEVTCVRYQLTETGSEFELRYLGKNYSFQCTALGKANLKNAVAAATVGFALGVEGKAIQKALKNFKGRSMRMERILLQENIALLNDCYNANPSSMKVALETLALLKGKNPGLAILGEMFEMGELAKEGHRLVGESVAQNKIGFLMAVGPYAGEVVRGAVTAGMPAQQCLAAASQIDLYSTLEEWARLGGTILVKGSRGAQMEKVTEKLKEFFKK